MEISRRCGICIIDLHRASNAKHLRIKKRLGNIRQDKLIIPDWYFKEEQTPIKNKIKKIFNPKTLKQIAREKLK